MDADRLVRAIRAALDETERIALRAGANHPRWTYDRETFTVSSGEWCIAARKDDGSPINDVDGEHIAHNDPAAVLRRVATDRRVLDRHEPRRLPATHYRPEVVECEHCVRMCHSRSGLACEDLTDAPWPCDEIRDLADRLGINPETETP